MQMNALKGWFNRQCQPSESALPTYYMSADRLRILKALVQGTISSGNARDTLIFSSLSFYRYPFKNFFLDKAPPPAFFIYYLFLIFNFNYLFQHIFKTS